MRHSVLALPAILRTSILLAAASQHTFSVHDDILAFPQYEVQFPPEFVLKEEAERRLQTDLQAGEDGSEDGGGGSDVQAFQQSAYDTGKQDAIKEDAKARVEYQRMMLGAYSYLCSIPHVKVPETQPGPNATVTEAEEQKELARANDRGWELLSGMQGNCVYFISGWWSYRFCYREGVKQFHQLPPGRGVPPFPPVEDPGVEGYYLGTYKAEKEAKGGIVAGGGRAGEADHAIEVGKHNANGPLGELVQRGESRYLVQRLDGGTVCDLTGKERRIEIQYHCNPLASDRISLIKETSTCAYLMVVQTPRLCNDVAFLPPQKDHPNTIKCAAIVNTEQEGADYLLDLKSIGDEEAEEAIWAANADAAAAFNVQLAPKVVGDILIGGHELVPEGVKLDKSAIVGGGKETYVDTIANSAGRLLTQEQMDKLGLGDPRAVEKLRKELEKFAKGAAWKLDVVDTPRGREYRGIIGDDDDEKKEGKGEKAENKGDKQEDKQQGGSQEEYYKEQL